MDMGNVQSLEIFIKFIKDKGIYNDIFTDNKLPDATKGMNAQLAMFKYAGGSEQDLRDMNSRVAKLYSAKYKTKIIKPDVLNELRASENGDIRIDALYDEVTCRPHNSVSNLKKINEFIDNVEKMKNELSPEATSKIQSLISEIVAIETKALKKYDDFYKGSSITESLTLLDMFKESEYLI